MEARFVGNATNAQPTVVGNRTLSAEGRDVLRQRSPTILLRRMNPTA